MDNEALDFPREIFEPVASQPIEIEELGRELLICFKDIDGPCEIRTCYGDICKIVNALMDYSRLLEMVRDQWELEGFQQVRYEYYAEKLRAIARKYQTGIHYDYDAAVEKCRKKREKKQRDDGVGGEAMELAYRRSLRTVAKAQASEPDGSPSDIQSAGSPWEDL